MKLKNIEINWKVPLGIFIILIGIFLLFQFDAISFSKLGRETIIGSTSLFTLCVGFCMFLIGIADSKKQK